MNLREAIEAYANAVSRWDYYEGGEDAQRADAATETLRQRWQDLNALLAVAEAAIAHAEFQISSHSRNGDDAPMDGATYIRERNKLWDAFMAARAKAANQ